MLAEHTINNVAVPKLKHTLYVASNQTIARELARSLGCNMNTMRADDGSVHVITPFSALLGYRFDLIVISMGIGPSTNEHARQYLSEWVAGLQRNLSPGGTLVHV